MAGVDVQVNADNSGDAGNGIKSAIATALESIGLAAEGYAKLLCPVDTGNLRNSITHITDGKEVYIGTNVEYAPPVELGTYKRAAKPFLRPAAEDHASEYAAMIEKALKG